MYGQNKTKDLAKVLSSKAIVNLYSYYIFDSILYLSISVKNLSSVSLSSIGRG